jgi:TonB-linked SusC/RagA family outer membrane protein
MKKNNPTGNHSTEKIPIKHFFLIMRTTFILLLICVFCAMAETSYTQNARVTINKRNVTLKEVLNDIEKQTDYLFIYSNEVNTTEKVSIRAKQKVVSEVLNSIFEERKLSYSMEGNHILLSVNENDNIDSEMLSPNIIQQQKKHITGSVVDQNGEAIIGANIIEDGTTNGTITDNEGKFSFEVNNNAIVRISYIGYIEKNINTLNQQTFNITLIEDTQSLDELVVIGYGAVRKKDLTGAVSQVRTEQFETQQSTNILDYLNGTVAGFNSNIGTSASGSSSMEIRGPASISASNSPLIVLDGVIYNGSINSINPRDIETIDILKDASSAAVYGSRSAAGVVIINTKRGEKDRLYINFSSQLGLTDYTKSIKPNDLDGYLQRRLDFQERSNPSKPAGYYRNPDNLPDGVDIETWQNYDASHSSNPTETWMDRLALRDIEQENYLNGKTYDWFDAVTSPGLRQNYDINISDGTGKTKYFWSLAYTDNKGYLLGDEYKTFRTRVNADTKISDWLTVGINAHFANRDNSAVPVSLWNATAQSPLGNPYDENGELKWYPHDDSGMEVNPFLNHYNRDNFNLFNDLFGTLYTDIKLPLGFSFKTSFVNRLQWEKDYYYIPTSMPQGDRVGGMGERRDFSLYEWQLDNILSWKKTLGIHDFFATFLYNAEKRQSWEGVASNQDFPISEALSYHQLNAGSSPTINNDDTYSTGTALMARLNYTLMNKYLITLSIRRDGYSAFGISNPYAIFPSGAFAWNISEESFFKVNWIDRLKIRTSYGINGNRDIGIYSALSRLGTTKYLSNGSYVSGVFSSTMANNDLKWEKTKALNLGIDFSILNNRIHGMIDYYDMTTNDLLLTRSLPTIIGYNSIMSNMGELENKGFEFTLNSLNVENEDYSWRSTFTFSLNRNKIIHLYGDKENITDEEGNIIGIKEADDITNEWFIGQALDRIWDYNFLGIYQLGEEELASSFGKAPGDTKLQDVDNNGVSTQEDKVFQGYTKPRYRLGLRNEFSFFKNFQFSFFLRADLGHFSKNGLLMQTSQVDDRRNAYSIPYWTPENPTNKATRLNTANTPSFTIYESRSFIRLQDVSLSYNLPENALGMFKLNGCRFYLSSRNLLTFTKWSGWDPESGNTPMPRIFTFGIDLTL